ncbi:hypothetical protein ASPZODRAFT_131856 [Penicilliopsis zonata CBS 506.65]|uniref:Uncharacterized protein n=1 Tax=Penicilliopsis zonata CBS 506.65 TaxID=1073090 RepID=A0A1L9SI93_9EURO|nr:hypothetical protein ASPZODRAFT_131856 [Penicilliopsis zonata CBS 506.65]OJJ46939.1 hypothetical protein ASPZODRAFT_131856 [Penicilliopsis zonata CBS 506.65]
MGWFWGDNKDDPVKKLDPNLRDYLEHQGPSKYVPTTPIEPSKPGEPTRLPNKPIAASSGEGEEADTPQVPSASLFPDGRYAHLWKTYKPPREEEQTGMNGASRVVEKYKEHKDSVQRAAMENCALEQEALTFCFQTGNWQQRLKARATMCSEENGKFSRCFTTQAKFLQALGYAASFDYDPEREERIQMHADKLYHEMLDYEKQVKDAQAAGMEPPPLTSLFNPGNTAPQEVQAPKAEKLPAGFKPSKPWEQLSPHERELELRAHNAQLAQQQLYVQEASPFMKSQEDQRAKRQQRATSWFGETIGRWVS